MIEIMKQIKWMVSLFAAVLVMGCDSLVENYKFDTGGYGTKDWDIIDYCESPVAYQMANYGKAMRLAGMEDVLAQGNLTCVIPNDDAFDAFVGESGYGSLEEVPAPVLRDLLMYLIFPGDHRCLTMEPGEVRTVNSLRGEPISIKRSENVKSYAMTINGENDLPGYRVESQDYQFKNNIVGQLVLSMPYYKPTTVPVTSPKPEDYAGGGGAQERIDISEDTFISQSGKTTAYNNNKNGYGTRVQNRSAYYAFGLIRFPLPESRVVDNLAVAKLVVNVHKLGAAYPSGERVCVSISEINPVLAGQWSETTATWNSILAPIGNSYKNLQKELAGAGEFIVPSPVPSKTSPQVVEIDITGSIVRHYEAKESAVDYVVYNMSEKINVSGAEIQIMDKDFYSTYGKAPYILLQGPSVSRLTVTEVNPLVTTGMSTPFTDEILRIAPPADPEGLDFSPQNILLVLSDLPTNGVLTLYGVPIQKGQKFTYYEMANGFVKYVRTAEGEDSFKLKVLDYLDGMVEQPVTITVQ